MAQFDLKIDLKKLVQKREEILKAKLFMFLHDVGKLQPGHQAKFIREFGRPATRFKHNTDILHHRELSSISGWITNLPPNATPISLASVIEKHHGATEKNDGIWPVFAQRVDRMDSGWDRDYIISTGVQPLKEFISIDSPFGWTRMAYKWVDNPSNIKCGKRHPWSLYYAGPTKFDKQEQDCLERLFRCLVSFVQEKANSGSPSPKISVFHSTHRDILRVITEKACGDTRYTVNDITLWDHSISTAILFKILAAWSVSSCPNLTNNRQFPRGNDKRFADWFRPQLLHLRIDGLAYLAASNNIPDLLARRELLQKVYDAWRDILEWEFPLAGEVYRDENGPVFLTFLRDKKGQGEIPLKNLTLPKDSCSCQHVLPEAYQQATTLEEYLRKAIVVLSQDDLTLPPEIPLHTYTQKRTGKPDEKSLGDLLAEEQQQGLWLQGDVPRLSQAWKDWEELKRKLSELQSTPTKSGEELCQICGLRPQGYGRWLITKNDAARQEQEWENHYKNRHNPKKPYSEKSEEERECQVCKAISRGMCGVCLERRVKRAEIWVQGIHKSPRKRLQNGHPETVWLDEVADKNGRLALIVGYFPLEHWLDGTLIETLGMFKQSRAEAPPTNRCVSVADEKGNKVNVVLGPKPVSYSRIRRIWETTRRFWQDVAPTDAPLEELERFCQNHGLKLEDLWEGPLSLEASLAGEVIGSAGPRLEIRGIPDGIQQELGDYHAYELHFPQGVKMAVVWDVENKRLITAENLVYIASRLGWLIPRKQKDEKEKDYQKRIHQEAATFVQKKLQQSVVMLEEPSHYAGKSREIGSFTPEVSVIHDSTYTYTPLIPILAEPRTFMALVPADKAVDVVRAIKAKYEREMGKVRNRLPLHLGIVFADAHQPLRTVLDAGRRMLKRKIPSAQWVVVGDQEKGSLESKGIYLKHITATNEAETQLEQERPDLIYGDSQKRQNRLTEQYKKWHRIVLYSEPTGRVAKWYVPAVMGDGQTDDWWYPFAFFEKEDEPKNRDIYYKATNPWQSQHPWLVHVSKLQPGDVIYFTPATLDFIFLDHGGRRFEIAYDDQGRRHGTLRRPYLLDELDDLVECWELLAGKEDGQHKIRRLSSRQLHIVRDLIEGKRAEWFENPMDSVNSETFRCFCESVLRNAEWQTKPGETEFKRLTHWAVTGLLADAVELFYHIMKERPVDEEEGMP